MKIYDFRGQILFEDSAADPVLTLNNCMRLHIDLRGANLSLLQLPYLDLNGADLRHVNFGGSNLYRCRLINCLLTDTNFDGAVLEEADLTGSETTRCSFRGAKLINAILPRTSNDIVSMLRNEQRIKRMKERQMDPLNIEAYAPYPNIHRDPKDSFLKIV